MMRWRLLSLISYISIALVTFGGQIVVRYSICASPVSCGISFMKAVVWTLIWPIYLWVVLANDHIKFGVVTTLIIALALAFTYWTFRPFVGRDQKDDPRFRNL